MTEPPVEPLTEPPAAPLAYPVPLDQLTQGDEIQQTGFWGAYKARFGSTPYAFRIRSGGHMLVLIRGVAPGVRLGYVPYGPVCPSPPVAQRAAFLAELASSARPHLPRGTVFVRFDLPWPVVADETMPQAPGVRALDMEIQPRHTVVLDLSRTDAELLAGMHAKTRYNIGLAERRGVGVDVVTGPADLDTWYDIKVESDRRDGIVTHSRAYFAALMRPALGVPGEPLIRLFRAQVGEKVLGGIIVSLCGREARYLHGASLGEGRNTMFSYALQWAAIRWAREQGASVYDLYGIPPDDDPRHPMHGLYRFKTGFGGAIVHRQGCHDAILSPAIYALLRLPERVRYFYYKTARRWLASR